MKTANWIRLISYGLILIPIQVLVINNLELNRYMFPQIYILLLLTLPVNIQHWVSYLIAFVIGFTVDMFTYTPGLHAFTCVSVVFLRYVYFNNFVDKEWLSTGISPDFNTTDGIWLVVYVSIYSLFFHFILLTLENFSFIHYGITLLKILYSSSLAIFLILLLLFTFRARTSDER
ncbi:MAG: hypothetical protein H6608_10170 [Flavobacteriales bacterium]|nr:hypothetical protein [Bacteroidota bacterium]MCB9241489.1 hypothetical protein [Flavobacteriales bacterium]